MGVAIDPTDVAEGVCVNTTGVDVTVGVGVEVASTPAGTAVHVFVATTGVDVTVGVGVSVRVPTTIWPVGVGVSVNIPTGVIVRVLVTVAEWATISAVDVAVSSAVGPASAVLVGVAVNSFTGSEGPLFALQPAANTGVSPKHRDH